MTRAMNLTGIHHLTAVTADARGNHAFYTGVLGMRLVKKTVNQDDVAAYHLFYADGRASPGTDVTFFDWPVGRERRGTQSIVAHRPARRRRSGLATGPSACAAWASRTAHRGARTGARRSTSRTRRASASASSTTAAPGESHPWDRSPVPAEHQIRGLGPITISVPDLEPTDAVLTEVMGMRRGAATRATDGGREVHVYEMGAGGPAAELHVAVEPDLPPARRARAASTTSPSVRRTRSTTGPGPSGSAPCASRSAARSTATTSGASISASRTASSSRSPPTARASPPTSRWRALGERLALPPFLEPRRAAIEAGLKPL